MDPFGVLGVFHPTAEFYFLFTVWDYGNSRGPKYVRVPLLCRDPGKVPASRSEDTCRERPLVDTGGLVAAVGPARHSRGFLLLGLPGRRQFDG